MAEPWKARFKDYYQILGVDYRASIEEIRQARNRMAQIFHPDMLAHRSQQLSTIATKMMQEVNEAYEVLTDQELRARYDREYQLRILNQAQGTTPTRLLFEPSRIYVESVVVGQPFTISFKVTVSGGMSAGSAEISPGVTWLAVQRFTLRRASPASPYPLQVQVTLVVTGLHQAGPRAGHLNVSFSSLTGQLPIEVDVTSPMTRSARGTRSSGARSGRDGQRAQSGERSQTGSGSQSAGQQTSEDGTRARSDPGRSGSSPDGSDQATHTGFSATTDPSSRASHISDSGRWFFSFMARGWQVTFAVLGGIALPAFLALASVGAPDASGFSAFLLFSSIVMLTSMFLKKSRGITDLAATPTYLKIVGGIAIISGTFTLLAIVGLVVSGMFFLVVAVVAVVVGMAFLGVGKRGRRYRD